MVKVAPLDGIIYNQEKVEIKDVIAPPYDVISEKEQDCLYELSNYNIVQLILGKTFPSDNQNDNRYTRAKKTFDEWKEKDVLTKTQKPCIFYYIQSYTSPRGEKVERKGFIAKNLIEDFSQGNIFPHEFTMGGPKQDRLNLMKECQANFSQIFMVYSDPEKQIEKAINLNQKPFINVEDQQGVKNTVYIIDDKSIINKIQETMKNKPLLIADGHHRYETAIAYRNHMRTLNPNYKEEEGFNWVMSYYTNLDDKNLKVYPTHRIITKTIDIKNLEKELKQYFEISEMEFDSKNKEHVKEKFIEEIENKAKDNIAFGICAKNSNKYLIAQLKEKEQIDKILDQKQVPELLKRLDLTVLHKIVISDMLNISEHDQMTQTGIKYIKKEEEAFEAVNSNTAEVVFIMATPKIKDIKDISQNYRMPQKSTYFYPKLLSGIVINPL